MTAFEIKQKLTFEQFLELEVESEGFYELVDGEVARKLATRQHDNIADFISGALADEVNYLVFKDRHLQEGINIHDLTESQQLVLRAIANDDTLWKPTDNYISSILQYLGIKGSPVKENLMKFLNGDKLNYGS